MVCRLSKLSVREYYDSDRRRGKAYSLFSNRGVKVVEDGRGLLINPEEIGKPNQYSST